MFPKTLRHLIAPKSTRPSDLRNEGPTVHSSVIRNQLNTSTWLLLGALAQIVLSFLPIRKAFTILPVVFVVLLQTINHIALLMGWKRNSYLDRVIPGKVTALFPTSASVAQPKDDKICLVLLSARSNHPNGIFARDFGKIGDYFMSMRQDLEVNATTNGFLGARTWLGASDRTTSSETLTIYYFKSMDDVHNFAHGPVHREGWDFWNKLVKQGKAGQYSLMHEVFEAPKGSWECVYLNCEPTNFGSTLHPIENENGVVQWVSPLIDAKGKYRTSNGRQGIDDGTGNDKYGDEPY